MARFPIFVELEGKKVLVIGGGKTAARKVRTLLAFGPKITILSKDFRPELREMAVLNPDLTLRQLVLNRESVHRLELVIGKEIKDSDLVICASSFHELNTAVVLLCRQLHIPVNCADNMALSTFLFPAIVKRGEIVAGISTSGVPALTRHLRQRVEKAIPAWYGDFSQELFAFREALIAQDLSEEEKKRLLYEKIEEACMNHKENREHEI